MFRILTNKQTATFKSEGKMYKIEIERRVDNKSHITVKEIFIDAVPKTVFNQYAQAKSVGEKDLQIFAALEEFYPAIIKKKDENVFDNE